jgi:hypothetical protein
VVILSRWPLHPLLFAAYAVLFLYAANVAEVLPDHVVSPLAWAVACSAVVLLVAALLTRSARRGGIIATAVVLAVAYLGHLATQVAALVDDPLPDWVWLALAVAIVIAGTVYALLARGSLATSTAVLNVFAIVLVAISLVTIIPSETSRVVRASEGEPVSTTLLPQATRVPDRDIFFIVLDRYGSAWSLEHGFGVTSTLPDDLAARGFQVIPGARANFHASDFSIATMLDMDLVTDHVDVDPPSVDRTPVRQRLARHQVGRFLRANGYRYVHLGGWWEPTRRSPIADEVLALGKTTEFESVLHEATLLPMLERTLGLAKGDTHSRDQHRDMAQFAFRQLEQLAAAPGRTFVFAHLLMPHPPYVLGVGGRAIHADEAKARPESELMQEQLEYTNERIRAIVDALLAGPDESDPIIVITGDEGPYLCYEVDCVDGSDEDYGIRLGVLRAYYLPGIDHMVPPDDSGVNVFRMILREYFGVDLPDLPNRSYTWDDTKKDLYTLRDVTESLPTTEEALAP